ncbi:MAG: rod shape-determining protein MreD [Bacteroidetes bacterium]|nr:rod shape-determining protein MreD [Bacteroidota bacterium]
MRTRFPISFLFVGFLSVLLQVTIFQQFHVFNLAKPLIYVFALLFYPMGANRAGFMIYAFAMGLIVDIFSLSYGINAFASVIIAYTREPLIKVLLASDLETENYSPHVFMLGFTNFLLYVMVTIFIHGALVLSIESFSASNIWRTLFAILTNTLITTILIVIVEILFYRSEKRRPL